MNENPNTQSSNNDLDSLLQEFQSLSKESVETPQVDVPVSNTVPSQTQPVSAPEPTIQAEKPITPTVTTPPPAVESVSAQPVEVLSHPDVSQAPQAVSPTLDTKVPQPEQSVAPAMPQTQPEVPQAPAQPSTVPTQDTVVSVEKGQAALEPASDSNGSKASSSENVASPSDNNQDKNQGGKGDLAFIIIILVIVGVFIFFMPKIDDLFDKKPGLEKKPTPTPTPTLTASPKPVVNQEKTMECTAKETKVNDTQSTQNAYRIYYLDNKVTKVERIVKIIYADTVEETNEAYLSTQNTCNSLATTYANITGYSVVCANNNKTFTSTYSYDLKTFVNPTQINIGTTAETISSDIKYEDAVETVKTNLESQGMTCK